MHIVIPICIQRSPYAYREGPFSDPHMHTGIEITPLMHTAIDLNHRMHTGISVMRSPYAYGDLRDPRMHMGIHLDPRMHTGITRQRPPYAYGDRYESHYAYGDLVQSPYAYRDCMTHNLHLHTGISSIPVCIWGFI